MRTTRPFRFWAALILVAAPLLVSAAACEKPRGSATVSDASAGTDVIADGYDPTSVDDEWRFPKAFLWGSSTAGFQIDMGCPTLPASVCEDPSSDWYAYVTDPATIGSPGTYLTGDPPSTGPGYWELYESDLNRVSDELHNNAFRFSFEWSRIFPTATDGVEGYQALRAIANADALAAYHAQLRAMRKRGISPLATVIHYTLPLWLHDAVTCHVDFANCTKRGWVDRERAVREAAKYGGFLAREFGEYIDWWATLNEPYQVMLFGYLLPNEERTNPPGLTLKVTEAKIVIRALIEAHARIYDAIKENDVVDADGDGVNSRIGVVYPLTPVAPKDPKRPLDVKAAENVFYLWNAVYLNAVIHGELDEKLDGTTVYHPELADRMDYFGMNYYFGLTVEGTASPILPALSPLSTLNPLSLVPGGEDAPGFYQMLRFVHDNYGLPIVVTENGASDKTGDVASGFLVRHLHQLKRAINDGVDVRGYFYWSLMDNYEWNHGTSAYFFGLFAVDPADPQKKRTRKPVADVYRRISTLNGLPRDLIREHVPAN